MSVEMLTQVTADEQKSLWSQQLQRRVMRLLLQHDESLFRRQFRHFFVNSALPQIPLLQQYDRYMRLRVLSSELLDDILLRIRRQLSLKTSHARLHEEAPTRGDIDWMRTTERSWSVTPGLPPLRFDTRLRQRTLETPENVLTVALLLMYRQELQMVLKEKLGDEDFDVQEHQVLSSYDARVERELAAPYARTLLKKARMENIDLLLSQVVRSLRPGVSPYRDLLNWWQRFDAFRVGRTDAQRVQALASRRDDEKVNAWLYELWIALECIHLFAQEGVVQTHDIVIATDALQCTFSWKHQRLRFIYNRQLDTSTTYKSNWEYGPATRPDYIIERAEPLEVHSYNELIWREPPFVLDAKYYLSGTDPSNTHGPLKKLLGDMTLLGAHAGALFFPLLPEPKSGGEEQATRIVHHRERQYTQPGSNQQKVYLYHIEPAMELLVLQQRLRALLDRAIEVLPVRPNPICEGIYFDADTINSSHTLVQTNTILCPKKHIGNGVFDLVDVERDCLKNPRLCHVMGQAIIPPFLIRATNPEQLAQQGHTLRERNDERLQQAEAQDDEARAELLRERIFIGVGQATELYVKVFGDTRTIEENLEHWAFGEHWKLHPHSLTEPARNALVSGEYIWQNSRGVDLHDWAAPAIQYCRALEFELKQRLYAPCPQRYTLNKAGFTMGTIVYSYNKRDANWSVFCQRVIASGSSVKEFEDVLQRMATEGISQKRNTIAHGGVVTNELAAELRESIIGGRNRSGILCWFVENVHR